MVRTMLEIRPGVEADKPAVLALIRKVHGDEAADRAARRWDWQWFQDPRLKSPGFQGVVVTWEGQILASMSTIPAGLTVKGEASEGRWFTDALVDFGQMRQAIRWQRRNGTDLGLDLRNGLALAMLDDPASGPVQMGKHLTTAMAAVCRKINFPMVGGTASWARILTFRQPLGVYVGRGPAWLLGGLIDLFLPRLPHPKRSLVPLEGPFDERFDRLWENARLTHTAITRRDGAVLNWRYRAVPDTAIEVRLIEDDTGLLGYIIWSSFERHRQRRSYILDILARDDAASILQDLLSGAMREMRARGVHKLECYTGSDAVAEVLARLGFGQRPAEGDRQTVHLRGVDMDRLYVTRGDGDGG